MYYLVEENFSSNKNTSKKVRFKISRLFCEIVIKHEQKSTYKDSQSLISRNYYDTAGFAHNKFQTTCISGLL